MTQDAAKRARTRAQWIEWIDSACPHHTHDVNGSTIALFRSGCADCWMETVNEARREERDVLTTIKSLSKTRPAHLWTDMERQVFDLVLSAFRRPPASAPEGTK